MSAKTYNVGVIGATGAVGIEMVKVLHDRKFPVQKVHLFASARSAGSTLSGPYGDIVVELFTQEAARKMDVVLMAVSGSFAKEHGEALAAPGGPIVIDNSSAFRLDPKVPLVVPEINMSAIGDARFIANPNCTTAIAVMALWPLHKKYRLKKVIASTYQAASGAGAEGIKELLKGCEEVLQGKKHENEFFAHPLPFNVIPHIDTFQENGYTKEEMKVTWETQKIFNEPDLPVSCTAVRIPTKRAHSEAITIETELDVTPQEAKELLESAPGVKVVDCPEEKLYPMPLNASEQHDVEVGRIRQSLIFGKKGLDLFICGDQLLRGAALNAVLIGEAALGLEPWCNAEATASPKGSKRTHDKI
jgi:aspartate-semialdehyde dehydrogenase